MAAIPVVDLAALSLELEDGDSGQAAGLADTGTALAKAFSTVGFCYVRNHGLQDSLVTSAFEASRRFFNLPCDVKHRCARPSNDKNHGYVAMAVETLNPERPPDFREAFNFCPYQQVESVWPTAEEPGLRTSLQELFSSCRRLSSRILHALALGLDLKDRSFLDNCHRFVGETGNPTTLRTLYYPAITQELQAGQIRCGEHSDYGSFTLLFQDNIGGLQVQGLEGDWVDATPIPGTIVLNIGDALQRWTADHLKATRHRVIIPEAEVGSGQSRQSIAFFVHPDNDVLMECLDGSKKYPPVTAMEYLQQRFAATY